MKENQGAKIKTLKKNILQLEKHLGCQALKYRPFVNLLMKRRSQALLHQQVTEELTNQVFRQCFLMFHKLKTSNLVQNRTFYTLVFQQKSKWMTFLDKLSLSQDQNMLPIILLQILVQESISKEKAYRHYWNPVFKETSEKWSLPIVTDYAGLDLNSLKPLLPKQVEESPFLVTKTMKLMKQKNSQKTYLQLLPSLLADKWDAEAIKTESAKQKTIKIKIYPTQEQKNALNEIFSVYNYVYNKTNALLKNKTFDFSKWHSIRDHLVTASSKKLDPEYIKNTELIALAKKHLDLIYDLEENKEIDILRFPSFIKTEFIKNIEANIKIANKEIEYSNNPEIKDFEKKVHKDIRANAVQVCCQMYKSAIANLKNGNIRWFNIGYKKKKSSSKCFSGISPNTIKFQSNGITMMRDKLGKNLCQFKISKRNYKKFNKQAIAGESKVLYDKGNYFIGLTLVTQEKNCNKTNKICGIDPGLRSFLTVFDNQNIVELNNNRMYIKKLNQKIQQLKAHRNKSKNQLETANNVLRKRRRKRHFNKIEKKKIDYTDAVHWGSINFLLKNYDYILLGDIKSHDIVKNGLNKKNNQEFNDLKFYVFKQRLLYKARLANKFVKFVNEFNTTKTCSSCGTLNHTVGCSEVFNCSFCKMVCGRDTNAAKNILLKGILL